MKSFEDLKLFNKKAVSLRVVENWTRRPELLRPQKCLLFIKAGKWKIEWQFEIEWSSITCWGLVGYIAHEVSHGFVFHLINKYLNLDANSRTMCPTNLLVLIWLKSWATLCLVPCSRQRVQYMSSYENWIDQLWKHPWYGSAQREIDGEHHQKLRCFWC